MPFARFDVDACLAFCLDTDIPCLPVLSPPIRSDVDAYVRGYFSTSPSRFATGPNVTSVVKITVSTPPVSLRLVVSPGV